MYQEPLAHLQAFLHLLEKILGRNCHESKICKEGKKARLVHVQQVIVHRLIIDQTVIRKFEFQEILVFNKPSFSIKPTVSIKPLSKTL